MSRIYIPSDAKARKKAYILDQKDSDWEERRLEKLCRNIEDVLRACRDAALPRESVRERVGCASAVLFHKAIARLVKAGRIAARNSNERELELRTRKSA